MTSNFDFYNHKTILVTGGAGSIGSLIVTRLLLYHPSSIRVFDNNESGIFSLLQRLNSRHLRPLVGDVRDEKRLLTAMRDVDIVIHAAALKHVPLSEYNPLEAVQTNILGTQNVISSAINANVRRVVNISTDKAVNPVNVMGATKLVAERLIATAHLSQGRNTNTIFCSVRFGNVISSNGSVIPVFQEQIKNGGPVTITSKDMTRFFMTLSDAVGFILKAGVEMEGREIFIPKMPAVKIIDLARVLIEESAARHGLDPNNIEIQITGIRPGEKIYESLITSEEATTIDEDDHKFVLRYPVSPTAAAGKIDRRGYDSATTTFLNQAQIKELILQE